RREAGIPGLDYSNDDEESRRRRVPFAKPVPKPFEKAWRSVDPYPGDSNNRMTNSLDPDDSFYPQSAPQPPNFPRGSLSMLDDYSRGGGPPDFDTRG
ncbi:unnamed protein product, partial [Adineta steineri]